MIRIQVDIIRFGDKSQKIPISEIEIANIGEYEEGHQYRVIFYQNELSRKDELTVTHNREDGISVLIEKVLNKINNHAQNKRST